MDAYEAVPEDYRETAVCVVDSDYETGPDGILASYARPETDEEMAERIERSRQSKQEWEDRWRRQYEALKAKYGS